MTNLFDDAFETLGEEMRAAAGITLTYTDGSGSVELVGVQGFTNHRVMQSDGASIIVRSDDFHVAVADLVIDSVPVRPENQHRISYVRGGKRKTFVVVSPTGQNCFTLVDHETAYRIHAAHEKTEDV